MASAATFVTGGLLAARLAARSAAGLVLGMYYGGTGVGIVASALLVPPLAARAVPHAWQGALVGAGRGGAAGHRWWPRAPRVPGRAAGCAARSASRVRWAAFGFGLAGYGCFGLGYIGYMTFVVTLLREQQVPRAQIVAFYVLLGLAVVASSWLWAGLLQR